jgi:hypothetical protein
MHENAARALQYYEDLPRRSGRPELRLIEAEAHPRRTDRIAHAPMAEVRSIRLDPARKTAPRRSREVRARRQQSVSPRIAGRPDRVAMWAVLLGFFLTGVAAATGHG